MSEATTIEQLKTVAISTKNELDRISGCVADAYAAVEELGGELPETQNIANLAAAIGSIPQNAAQLALQAICPTNKIIYDNVNKPSIMVYIPKFRLCDVMSTDDTSIHPAFVVNGQEIDGIYIGKFQSSVSDGRAYSLPAKDPAVNVTIGTVVNQNRAKGGNFHEITAAEWSAIALWCHKNGTEPKGNNDYGKDKSETLYKAVPSMSRNSSGRIQRVATGTGPVTWSHDGTLEGIWDLNGNVWEWCTGLRLIYGELQVIPYNNAADPACDLSVSSAAWKAIKADAASWDDLFVTPDGNGTTAGSVKLDWNGKWVWSRNISPGPSGPSGTAWACLASWWSRMTAPAGLTAGAGPERVALRLPARSAPTSAL